MRWDRRTKTPQTKLVDGTQTNGITLATRHRQEGVGCKSRIHEGVGGEYRICLGKQWKKGLDICITADLEDSACGWLENRMGIDQGFLVDTPSPTPLNPCDSIGADSISGLINGMRCRIGQSEPFHRSNDLCREGHMIVLAL